MTSGMKSGCHRTGLQDEKEAQKKNSSQLDILTQDLLSNG